MNILRRLKLLWAALWIGIFFTLGSRMIYYMTNDDFDSAERCMMHDFYNQDEIDILFLGASHVYCGVDPYTLGEDTGKQVFLASTSAQEMDGSLVLAKEAFKHYHPKQVFLEVSVTVAMGEVPPDRRTSLVSTYLISDYMENGINRFQYLLKASSPAHYINSFFPVYRYAENFCSLSDDLAVFSRKCSAEYKEYKTKEYVGRGLHSYDSVFHPHSLKESELTIDITKISDEWKESVCSIAELCKENQAELELIILPVSDPCLFLYRNYDVYDQFVQSFAGSLGIKFVDFNLLKESVLPFQYENYKDVEHISSSGRSVFTAILLRWMNGELGEEDFESNIGKKLSYIEPDVYGLIQTGEKEYTIFSNALELWEYRIEAEPYEEDDFLIQDFCSQTSFTVSSENAGKYTIRWRRKDNPEDIQSAVYQLY